MEKGAADRILRELRQIAPESISVSQLDEKLSGAITRRTLQRRLEQLVGEGSIERLGKGRGTAYRFVGDQGYSRANLAPPRSVVREDPADDLETERIDEVESSSKELDLGEELLELRDRVRAPFGEREAVGYRREFLDSYVPNETRYIPVSLSADLHGIGQSQHMAELPPGTYARTVLDRLLIDLSWNSSRLEGNTYSLLETDHLLALGKLDDERLMEAQMILNHKGAIEFLVDSPSELGFDHYTFCNLHALLTEGLLKSPKAEGRLRQIPVGIGGTVYHPTSVPQLVEEAFDLILEKAAAVRDSIEQAFFLMVHLPYLQPFEDGNKRLSRIGANLPLIQKNMSPLSFVDVPIRDYIDGTLAIYELNRVELLREVFAHAYARSAARYASIRNEIGDPEPLRVRYRDEIKDRMRDTVVRRLDKRSASGELRQWANKNVTASDRDKFVEMVETLLLDLSERNIARIRIRPSEFEAWWPVWTEE